MSLQAPLEDPRLAALDLLDVAVWISDPDVARIVWANRSAIALWQATTLPELTARDMGASETVRATLGQLRERVRRGERVRSDRTIYPKGVATPVEMCIGAFELPDGRCALLVEAIRAREKPDPERLRWAEAVRYAPVAVTTHTLDGATLSANTLAREAFGLSFCFADLFAQPDDAALFLSAVQGGRSLSKDVELRTALGVRTFDVEVRPAPDPVTGTAAILVSALDITARREAEKAKDDLISVVNHELRTPLTALRGALSLLAYHDAVTPQERAELLEVANQNALRLMRIVNDLLDVRKLAEGALELHRRKEKIGPIVQRAVDLQSSLAATSGVALRTSLPAAAAVADIDSDRILQVVANLLSNALKHTPRDSEVHVEVTYHEGNVRVSVRDQGTGVPTSFQEKLFGRFAQATATDGRTVSGTGLGLYIAKTLVEAHEGRLAYDPEITDGARFFFDLPALMPAS